MATRQAKVASPVREQVGFPWNTGTFEEGCPNSYPEKAFNVAVKCTAGRVVIGAASGLHVSAEIRRHHQSFRILSQCVAKTTYKDGVPRELVWLNGLADEAALAFCDPDGIDFKTQWARHCDENYVGQETWGIGWGSMLATYVDDLGGLSESEFDEMFFRTGELGIEVLRSNQELYDWAAEELWTNQRVRWIDLKKAIAEFPLDVPYLGC